MNYQTLQKNIETVMKALGCRKVFVMDCRMHFGMML